MQRKIIGLGLLSMALSAQGHLLDSASVYHAPGLDEVLVSVNRDRLLKLNATQYTLSFPKS